MIEILEHRTRAFRPRWLVLIAGVFVMVAASPGLVAQDADGPQPAGTPAAPEVAPAEDHDHAGVELRRFEPEQFTDEQRVRIERLFKEIICACPKEGWTKTLEGCPDGCANQQKNQVRMSVQQGISDAAILAAQESLHGPKVLARTRAEGLVGFAVYVLPFLALAVSAVVILVVLARWVRPSTVPMGTADSKASMSAEDRAFDDEIERELEEMD